MGRLEKLWEAVADYGLDAVLITNPVNRRYYSGFSGSSGVLLLHKTRNILVTDFRYWEQASLEAASFELFKHRLGGEFWQSVADLISGYDWRNVGFEAENVTYRDFQNLAGLLPKVEWTPLGWETQKPRWVKEAAEIDLIAKAAEITDRAWEKTLEIIKPGIAEREIALEFDYQLRRNGAEGSSFTTIMASGSRSALPHGTASAKKLNPGDLALLDGGALYQGYHADMTRTVVIGAATAKQREIYGIVLAAQKLALERLRVGLTGAEVDAVARDYIAQAGYGDFFGHGLGHGVGLEIHENPRLSKTEPNPLPVGAVVTVEPGIYLPGWGGIRIEDLVALEEGGAVRNLTGSRKEILLEV